MIKSKKTIPELVEFGIINIDKPTGPTSFSVGQFVKQKLRLRKTSHLGTLDPAVTGVLPIALNRACRLNEFLMHRDKEYIGIMRLHNEIGEKELNKEMKKFVGKIIQLPPVRSRVKRAEREREVKRFEIIQKDEKDVLFMADVQAGTYIRKLCSDLGEKIGGAHMLELRRIRAGQFNEDKIYDLYDFERAVEEYEKGNDTLLKEMIVPGEEALENIMPKFFVLEKSVKQLLTGKPIMKADLKSEIEIKENEHFVVYCENKFIGVYRKVDEKDIIGRPEFVLN